jgi:hypothetical protein
MYLISHEDKVVQFYRRPHLVYDFLLRHTWMKIEYHVIEFFVTDQGQGLKVARTYTREEFLEERKPNFKKKLWKCDIVCTSNNPYYKREEQTIFIKAHTKQDAETSFNRSHRRLYEYVKHHCLNLELRIIEFPTEES